MSRTHKQNEMKVDLDENKIKQIALKMQLSKIVSKLFIFAHRLLSVHDSSMQFVLVARSRQGPCSCADRSRQCTTRPKKLKIVIQ